MCLLESFYELLVNELSKIKPRDKKMFTIKRGDLAIENKQEARFEINDYVLELGLLLTLTWRISFKP